MIPASTAGWAWWEARGQALPDIVIFAIVISVLASAIVLMYGGIRLYLFLLGLNAHGEKNSINSLVEFGMPSKVDFNPAEAICYIQISSDETLNDVEISLYDENQPYGGVGIPLRWKVDTNGICDSDSTVLRITLHKNRIYYVPICYRDSAGLAIFLENDYIIQVGKKRTILVNHNKTIAQNTRRRFRLQVRNLSYRQFSPHEYSVIVPVESPNIGFQVTMLS